MTKMRFRANVRSSISLLNLLSATRPSIQTHDKLQRFWLWQFLASGTCWRYSARVDQTSSMATTCSVALTNTILASSDTNRHANVANAPFSRHFSCPASLTTTELSLGSWPVICQGYIPLVLPVFQLRFRKVFCCCDHIIWRGDCPGTQ